MKSIRVVLLILGLFTLLPACVHRHEQSYGDLLTKEGFPFSSATRLWLQTPSCTTDMRIPVEFKVLHLPAKVDPLEIGLGMAVTTREAWKTAQDKPRKGKLLVEVLSYPAQKVVGRIVWNEAPRQGEHAKKVSGSRQPLDNFILRISVQEAFEPPMSFQVIYVIHTVETGGGAGRKGN